MATKKQKTISVEKMLGKLTPEQSRSLAQQFNGGMGSKPPAKDKKAPKGKKK